jgi:hypothetical protein
MKLKKISVLTFITSYLIIFNALADTCPSVNDIVADCKGSSCKYYANTPSGKWEGNNKNLSQKLQTFNFVRFYASPSISKGKIQYCAYDFENTTTHKKYLRLFLKDKSKYWSINQNPAWKVLKHNNYICWGEGAVEKCKFILAEGKLFN